MSFIPVIKDEFSTSLLQSSVSHSEIILICWFAAQETYLHIIIIINIIFLSGFFDKFCLSLRWFWERPQDPHVEFELTPPIALQPQNAIELNPLTRHALARAEPEKDELSAFHIS